MRPRRSAFIIGAALALVLVLAGCGRTNVTYVDEGASYTRASALELVANADSGTLAEVATADSSELRGEALSGLRSKGQGASEAASLITSVMPGDSRGVPFYVERASYEGTECVVVVEAIGPENGALSDKRLWVLSETGDVLLSGTR